MACVKIKGDWGYIDKTGKIVIESQFVDARSFSDGMAVIGSIPSGYINREGNVVIKQQFYVAYPFRNGIAKVLLNNRSEGYIDKTGKFIWGPK